MLVIVPNSLRDAINAKLDAAFKDLPKAANADREIMYSQLVGYFNDYGHIPDFTIAIPGEGK
jgi:hypothetical protein